MIVIINGPLGVGKTEVAWKLIEKFDRAVMLDGDYLGAVQPFEIDDEQRVAYLYDTICHVARFHIDHGWNNLVVDYVFETPESLAQLRYALNEIDRANRAYCLTCSTEEIERRIRSRSGDPDRLAWESRRFRELQAIQATNARRGDLGYAFINHPQNTDRRFFRKRQPRTHHVYIVEAGSAELRVHLAFRDALRANPEWRDQYAAPKYDLADRHRNDRGQYTESKTDFVRRVLSITRETM